MRNEEARENILRRRGRPTKEEQEANKGNIVNFIRGNNPGYAVARLQRDRPDLHERVLAGELSPHAAAIEAGFRKRTVSIPLEPKAAAAALRRHFTNEELAELIEALVYAGGAYLSYTTACVREDPRPRNAKVRP